MPIFPLYTTASKTELPSSKAPLELIESADFNKHTKADSAALERGALILTERGPIAGGIHYPVVGFMRGANWMQKTTAATYVQDSFLKLIAFSGYYDTFKCVVNVRRKYFYDAASNYYDNKLEFLMLNPASGAITTVHEIVLGTPGANQSAWPLPEGTDAAVIFEFSLPSIFPVTDPRDMVAAQFFVRHWVTNAGTVDNIEFLNVSRTAWYGFNDISLWAYKS